VLALTTGESTRYIRGDDRGSSAGVPERDQIVLAARHEQVYRWVPLDILDVLSVASKDPFLSTPCESVTDWGIVRRPARGCPRMASRSTDHAVRLVMLEIPDDSGLVCRRDVCTYASDIMRLEPGG
jgi:hypothetical protein